MGIPENIDALLIKYDINQDCLARIADVAPSAITRWRNGAMPRKNAIANICNHFGLEEDDILSDKVGLAAKEHGLVIDFHTHHVKGMDMGYVPLLGKVHAGKPVEAEVYEDEMVMCPQFLIDQYPDIWAGKSEGDCMNNIFPVNCIYFVTAMKPHKNGQPEVWTIDEIDTVARRVYKTNDTLLLSPDSTNPDNKDIVIQADDGHVAKYDGAIVWFQSDGEVE